MPGEIIFVTDLCNKAVLINKSVAQIGFGCDTASRDGTGKKRYNFTKVLSIQKDFIKFDGGTDGAVGCNGDSGGPYLASDASDKDSCILAIHYNSDYVRFNKATNVFYSEVRDWIKQISRDKNLSICGITSDCKGVYYPL